MRATHGVPSVDGRIDAARRPVGLSRLFDLDDDFAARLPAADRALAASLVLTPVRQIPRGNWRVLGDGGGQPIGLVVVSGTLVRGSCVEDLWATELLGPGDVLQPWEELQAPQHMRVESDWEALEPVRLAVLDWRFAAAAARWPQLTQELVGRALRRSRLLVALLSVSRVRRLDDRLLLLLRILADRWGYVRPDGVHLRLRLTHETLARLAGAHRPSVSTALARLADQDQLIRRGRQLVLPLDHPR